MNFMTQGRLAGILLGLAWLSLCQGCNSAKYGEVSGHITLDGKPLPNVAVRFQDPGGSATIAKTDSSGFYQLRYSLNQSGAPIGTHKVTIFTPPPASEGTGERIVKEIIPAKYNKKSTLTKDVVAGSQTIDFDLVSDEKK